MNSQLKKNASFIWYMKQKNINFVTFQLLSKCIFTILWQNEKYKQGTYAAYQSVMVVSKTALAQHLICELN